MGFNQFCNSGKVKLVSKNSSTASATSSGQGWCAGGKSEALVSLVVELGEWRRSQSDFQKEEASKRRVLQALAGIRIGIRNGSAIAVWGESSGEP